MVILLKLCLVHLHPVPKACSGLAFQVTVLYGMEGVILVLANHVLVGNFVSCAG